MQYISVDVMETYCKTNHSIYMRHILLLTGLLLSGNANADLAYMPLRFELTASTPVVYEWQAIAFRLRITNIDKDSTYPVMIPGLRNHGRKLLYMTAYSTDDNNHYTEVAREAMTDISSPGPSGSSSGNVRIQQLKPGEHVDIKFRLHSNAHYQQQSAERHWFPQPLKTGTYQLLVWYQPYGNSPFDLYHYLDDSKGEVSTSKLNFYRYGTPSNYCKIEIKQRNPTDIKQGIAEHCSDGCRFCQHIKDENWNRVRHDIDRTMKTIVQRPGHVDKTVEDVSWLREHKEVAYLALPPESIILPFPAYWSQKIGFQYGNTVKYFDMTFQAGKVYRGRSRVQSMIFALFDGHKPILRTSDEKYVGVSNFEPVTE